MNDKSKLMYDKKHSLVITEILEIMIFLITCPTFIID